MQFSVEQDVQTVFAALQKTHNVPRAKRNALNLEHKKAEMATHISAALVIRMVTSSALPVRAAATLPGLKERERVKMRKLKLGVLLCLSAGVFIIVRRPKKNHPESSKLDGTFSIEQDCSWLNHGGFAMEKAGGH
jgi:hypothetical protein